MDSPELTFNEKVFLLSTDTITVISEAFELAEKHIYHSAESIGTPASYCTFYTVEESTDPKAVRILVNRESSYGLARFRMALRVTREKYNLPTKYLR